MKKKRSTSLLEINPKVNRGLSAYPVAKIQPFYMTFAKSRGLSVNTIIRQPALIHQKSLNTSSATIPMLISENQNNHFIKNCKLGDFQQKEPVGVATFLKKILPPMFHIKTDSWASGLKNQATGLKDRRLTNIKTATWFLSRSSIGKNGRFGNTLKGTICPTALFMMRVLAELGVLCVHLSATRNPNLPNGFCKHTKTAGPRFMPLLNVP